MLQEVQVGTILIEESALMARALGLQSEPYSAKWGVVQALDGLALDRKIHAAGWNFFFMAAEVRVMFLGALGANIQCNAPNAGKSAASKLQLSSDNWNRCQTIYGRALHHCFSSLAPHSTGLVPRGN